MPPRLGLLTALLGQIAELPVRHDQVALPLGVARVAGGEPLANREAGLVRLRARPSRSPCATRTSPILLWLTERSRCHSALPGSAAASRSRMARLAWYASSAPGEIALRSLHVADLVRG